MSLYNDYAEKSLLDEVEYFNGDSTHNWQSEPLTTMHFRSSSRNMNPENISYHKKDNYFLTRSSIADGTSDLDATLKFAEKQLGRLLEQSEIKEIKDQFLSDCRMVSEFFR